MFFGLMEVNAGEELSVCRGEDTTLADYFKIIIRMVSLYNIHILEDDLQKPLRDFDGKCLL